MESSPTDRLLTGALVAAPLVYLAADATYAVRGWDDPGAAVLHVLGAIGYGFVVVRLADWMPRASWLRALLLVTGIVGLAGNVGYGFDAIHASLGDTPLVDQSGAANLIKPLGLLFPVWLLVSAAALSSLAWRWQATVVLVAALAWPVAHIGNLGALAVAVDVALLVSLGSLAWGQGQSSSASSRLPLTASNPVK